MSDSEITTHRNLAVDDDPFNLRIVSHALQQAEYTVMTAGSGEEALGHYPAWAAAHGHRRHSHAAGHERL